MMRQQHWGPTRERLEPELVEKGMVGQGRARKTTGAYMELAS